MTGGSRLEARRVASARRRQRHRRAAVVTLLASALALVGAAVVRAGGGLPFAGVDAPPPSPSTAATTGTTSTEWPEEGSGSWRYAGEADAEFGSDGDLLRFQVAVEAELGVTPDEFAAGVDAVLGDPRGWTAGGERRFRRVGESDESDFTVFLATPGTSEEVCATGGLHTGRITSCHLPGEVIINVARWLGGSPGFDATLDESQAYALNHEVGHELGLTHEACPGPARLVPVMLPPALGPRGCVPNGWPYPRGERYAGPEIP